MSDPVLLKLTASEPLTIEQEYEMQETWRNDEDSMFICRYPKLIRSHTSIYFYFAECTFLILNKDVYERTKDEIGSLTISKQLDSIYI